MAGLSDDELLRMVTEDAANYRSDALDYAKAELRSRGIDYRSRPEDPPEDPPEGSDTDLPADPILGRRRGGCPSCNGPLRVATLAAEKEVTIVFSDNREERFVLVSVCGQCGLISMAVDLETEVQSQ
jgi:hypothetical protein